MEVGIRDAPWQDPERARPSSAERERVTSVVAGETDPAAAWAKLAGAGLVQKEVHGYPAWSYPEELFETCHSCKGTNEDWMYGGPCLACTHFGRRLAGYRPSPHPPTLRHVIEFGARAAAMPRASVAVVTLIERLRSWGGPTPKRIEWILEDVSLGDRRLVLPRCLVPVLEALRAGLGDPTISARSGSGWLTQGRHAWRVAARRRLDCAQGLDPFEPVEEIFHAGFYVELTPEAARIFC
jgi:hypothetical protein